MQGFVGVIQIFQLRMNLTVKIHPVGVLSVNLNLGIMILCNFFTKVKPKPVPCVVRVCSLPIR